MHFLFADTVLKTFTNQCGGSAFAMSDYVTKRYNCYSDLYSDKFIADKTIEYFTDTVVPHKIAVYEAGMEITKESWFKELFTERDRSQFVHNLLLHDLSKFSANEAFGYALYDPEKQTVDAKQNLKLAWHHHKMNNPHHPEYWLNPHRSGAIEPLPMPDIYIIEMIADMIGAGKTYGTPFSEWLAENLPKIVFANHTVVCEFFQSVTGLNVLASTDGMLTVEHKSV